MHTWLAPSFWSDYFKRTFIPPIEVFCEAVQNRLMPAFDSIEIEAERCVEAEYERLISWGGSPDADLSQIAELAQNRGLEHYSGLAAVKQSLINLSVVSLYHLFEQQLMLFHRKQVLHPTEENDIRLMNFKEIRDRLKRCGIDLSGLCSWRSVDELRLVANTIKHGEGGSAQELRNHRPDLFVHPVLRNQGDAGIPPVSQVYLPAGGEDVFVTLEDIARYRDALVRFWHEFSEAILRTRGTM
jgi:hypothetical protein